MGALAVLEPLVEDLSARVSRLKLERSILRQCHLLPLKIDNPGRLEGNNRILVSPWQLVKLVCGRRPDTNLHYHARIIADFDLPLALLLPRLELHVKDTAHVHKHANKIDYPLPGRRNDILHGGERIPPVVNGIVIWYLLD